MSRKSRVHRLASVVPRKAGFLDSLKEAYAVTSIHPSAQRVASLPSSSRAIPRSTAWGRRPVQLRSPLRLATKLQTSAKQHLSDGTFETLRLMTAYVTQDCQAALPELFMRTAEGRPRLKINLPVPRQDSGFSPFRDSQRLSI